MQSVANPPVPRCVQAQTFLDNISRDNQNREAVCGAALDVNTDLDEKYSMLMSRPQQQHSDRDHRRREDRGGIEFQYAHISAESKQRLKLLQQQQQQLHQRQHQQLSQQQSKQSIPVPSQLPHNYQQQQQHQQIHHRQQQQQQQQQRSTVSSSSGELLLAETILDSNFYGSKIGSSQNSSSSLSPRKQRQPPAPRIIIPQQQHQQPHQQTQPPPPLPPPPPQQQPIHIHGDQVPVVTQGQQQGQIQLPKSHLPSPPLTATSPESPSSLAIHLYVHHHHHHHAQTEPTASAQTSLPSPSSPPLSEEDPLATASIIVSSTSPTVASPCPLPILLPSLSIPECHTDNKNSPVIVSSCSSTLISRTTPPVETEDASASISWHSHPYSKPTASNTIAPSSSTTALLDTQAPCIRQPSPPKRRHRQQRPAQTLPSIPDPAMSAQLLSTITASDLARMYVHAAHHLHSHQPIRRYVMMKMIMTQAELIQYGRLRAEMPRAPGPSTGAQPRRTGFGTEANKGLSARPKVSSNLAQCHVLTVESEEEIEERERLAREEKMNRRMVIKVPWTQSLSSLASLSSTLSLKRSSSSSSSSKESSSQPHQQHKRPNSWYGGMLGGSSNSKNHRKDHPMEDEMDEVETGAGVGVGSLPDIERGKKLGQGRDRHRRGVSCSNSSRSEPDLYSVRRLEELELGTEGDEDDIDPIQEKNDGQGEGLARSGCGSGVTVEDEAEEMMDYWTMIRSRNNRSRRRQIRSLEFKEPDDFSSVSTSGSALATGIASHRHLRQQHQHQYHHQQAQCQSYRHQQQQQQQQAQHVLSHTHPQYQQEQDDFEQVCLESSYPSSSQTIPVTPPRFPDATAANLPSYPPNHLHSQRRQPMLSPHHHERQMDCSTSSSVSTSASQASNRNTSVLISTKGKGPGGNKKWISKRRNSQGNISLLPSSSSRAALSSSSTTSSSNSLTGSWSPLLLSSLPESQSVSGLVMLSLLFGVVYLVQGTNQFYNLQSAFLSIIL